MRARPIARPPLTMTTGRGCAALGALLTSDDVSGLPPMRNPPPHREVSVAVISMEAMGWPGLGDMVPSTRRQWRDARRVTSPRHNHGGGAALDESRLVVAMAAETTSGCGRDTLRRISQAPPSSARTRVTRAERCKVVASSAIGGDVCGHRRMCAHHVSHVHSFLLLYSTSTPAGHTPRTPGRIYNVIDDVQA